MMLLPCRRMSLAQEALSPGNRSWQSRRTSSCAQCDGMYYCETPFIMASKKGHVEVVQALLTAGADKEAKRRGMVGGGSWGGSGGKEASCAL